jgi:hypothetical protein
MKQIAICGRGGFGGIRFVESGADPSRAWDAQAAASSSLLDFWRTGTFRRRTGTCDFKQAQCLIGFT